MSTLTSRIATFWKQCPLAHLSCRPRPGRDRTLCMKVVMAVVCLPMLNSSKTG